VIQLKMAKCFPLPLSAIVHWKIKTRSNSGSVLFLLMDLQSHLNTVYSIKHSHLNQLCMVYMYVRHDVMINMYAGICGRMRYWGLSIYTFHDFRNGSFFIVVNDFENDEWIIKKKNTEFCDNG
jgi:hypothetical protein